MRWLVCILLLLIVNHSSGQNPDSQVALVQEISVNLTIQRKVPLFCPYRSSGSMTEFFKVGPDGNHVSIQALRKEQKPFIQAEIEKSSSSPIATYICKIKEDYGRSVTAAKMIIYDNTIKQVPRTIQYNSVTFKVKGLGESVDLECPLVSGAGTKWRRPAQYEMKSNIVNGRLTINKFTNSDYGAYYCHGDIPPQVDNIIAAKIILKPSSTPKEKSVDEDANYYYTEPAIFKQTLRAGCPIAEDPTDQVVWEKPPNVVLLDQTYNLVLNEVSNNDLNTFFYCRVTNSENPTINKVAKVLFTDQTSKYGIELSSGGSSIDGSSIPTTTRQMVLSCVSDPSSKVDKSSITWYRDGSKINTGNQLVLDQLNKNNFGNYSCKYQAEAGHQVTRSISLTPTQTKSSKVELVDPPGEFHYYHHKDRRELHCEIHQNNLASGHGSIKQINSSSIIWAFNNKKIEFTPYAFKKYHAIMNNETDKRIIRRDMLASSILTMKEMNAKNQGEYSCYVGDKMYTTHLFLYEEIVNLQMSPDHMLIKNKGDAAEFHCQISSEHFTYRDIKWRFYPEEDNSDRPIDLPDGAIIDDDADFSESSYVQIYSIKLEHAGRYECRVKNEAVSVVLKVLDPQIDVTPKNQTVRLGETARLMCEKKNLPEKVTWRRTDQKSLGHHESVREAGDKTFLIIKSLTWDYHNLTYRCEVGHHHDSGVIFVKGDCDYRMRQCADKTCISEKKFCDENSDCPDGSDESDDNCGEHCEPNQIMCKKVDNTEPANHCIAKHWECDGENDCGNNYDEMNCPIKNKDKCLGTHYMCNNNKTLIPRSYWCDKEVDCDSGDDENKCSSPQLVYPTGEASTEIFAKSLGDVKLTCIFVGRPIPTVIWRYNWGFLPKSGDIVTDINNTYSNCDTVTSILTISRIPPTATGVYTCEAMGKSRLMGPDYTLNIINSAQRCTGQMFNDGAYVDSECLRCYCSELNVECSSLKGFALNGVPKSASNKPDQYTVAAFDETLTNLNADSRVIFDESKQQYIINSDLNANTTDPNLFLRGPFELQGSWLMSYGYYIRYKVTGNGLSGRDHAGPFVVLYGSADSNLYWCRPNNGLIVYPTNVTRSTLIEIKMVDFEPQWYSDASCKTRATREVMMKTLTNITGVAIRIKYFENQKYMGISPLEVEYAAPYPKDREHTISLIENCNCPTGYSGTSCENKNP